MAIRRCPYCKAIIDEQDKYCNNCGTQLLFPEDEFVEEEIPGDRIVDEDETKEQELEEKGEERLEVEGEPEEVTSGGETPEEHEEEAEEREEEELEGEEEEEEEEEIAAEEEGEEEEEDSGPLEEPGEEIEKFQDEEEEEFGPDAEVKGLRLEEDDEEEIEKPTKEIEIGGPAGKTPRTDETDTKYKLSIEEDELVLKTEEGDTLAETLDEGKGKLEDLLMASQKKIAKAATPHDTPAIFQEGEETVSETKEELPPWASIMKDVSAPPADLEPDRETIKVDEIVSKPTPTRPEWTTDSGIGIPEKITQAGLPFGTAAVPATAEVKETVEEEEVREPGIEVRHWARFSLKLRSKLVDVVFITALWLISLWFTAQVIGVSFLQVIAGSPIPVLAFYFILLLLYFFLFLFFLGETLGDHYFSGED